VLTIDKASVVVDAAIAQARSQKCRPLSVVVLDPGGHVVCLKRDDGAAFLRSEIATAKAWGALGLGSSSRRLGERFDARPGLLGALQAMSGGRIVPVAGGILLGEDGVLVGAVGVSGASSDEDELCALTGIKAAGLEALDQA